LLAHQVQSIFIQLAILLEAVLIIVLSEIIVSDELHCIHISAKALFASFVLFFSLLSVIEHLEALFNLIQA